MYKAALSTLRFATFLGAGCLNDGRASQNRNAHGARNLAYTLDVR